MSVIATLALPPEDFLLGAALAADPDLRVRMERVVPVERGLVPYLWVADERVENIKAALDGDPDIESCQVVDSTDDMALMRVTWARPTDGFIDAVTDSDGFILEGIGDSDGWRFEVRFDDHESLSECYRACASVDLGVQLEGVHNPGVRSDPAAGTALTDTQRETLQVALERGYFEVPRRVNLVELAEELGVSDTAVSQRIRRGIAALLGESPADLTAPEGNEDGPDR